VNNRFWFSIIILLSIENSGMAQPESSLFHSSMSRVVKSERFQANAILRLNNREVAWSKLPDAANWQTDNVIITYTSDSVNWQMPQQGNTYAISFPNDVSVFYGLDRKEMQDKLLQILDSERIIISNSDSLNFAADKLLADSFGLRYGLLRQTTFINPIDSSLICNSLFPFESLVNAFKDTLSCNGLFPLKVVYHRYGYKQDTVKTDVPSLLKTLGAVGWPLWNLKENNEIALLIQHPFWGFDHVLFLRLEKEIWMGDFYSFVPNHNLLNMFKNYDSDKAGSHTFKIE
jgi:hypothetical protein